MEDNVKLTEKFLLIYGRNLGQPGELRASTWINIFEYNKLNVEVKQMSICDKVGEREI